MKNITFATNLQAAIFANELQGQMSDGHWENTRPFDHWKPWCDATVSVGKGIGRNFSAKKDNYDFNCGEMLDVIGKRMLGYARLGRAGYTVQEAGRLVNLLCDEDGNIVEPHYKTHTGDYWMKKRADIKELKSAGQYDAIVQALEDPEYTFKHMRKDLKEMKKTVRIYNTPQPSQ